MVLVLILALVKIVSQARGGAGLRSLVSSDKWRPRSDRESSDTAGVTAGGMAGTENKTFQQEPNVQSTKITSLTEV